MPHPKSKTDAAKWVGKTFVTCAAWIDRHFGTSWPGRLFAISEFAWLPNNCERQLQRYRYCSNGECYTGNQLSMPLPFDCSNHVASPADFGWVTDAINPIPGRSLESNDTEAFMFLGFMILPLLFVLYGIMQRVERRRYMISQVRSAGCYTWNDLSHSRITFSELTRWRQDKPSPHQYRPPLPPLDWSLQIANLVNPSHHRSYQCKCMSTKTRISSIYIFIFTKK